VSWGVADIPDQSGRSAVVTGANGGLGLETARALAAAGADVLMAARNQERATEAKRQIQATVPDANLTIVESDLGSLGSAKLANFHFGLGPPVRKPVLRPGIGRDISRLWEVSERKTGLELAA